MTVRAIAMRRGQLSTWRCLVFTGYDLQFILALACQSSLLGVTCSLSWPWLVSPHHHSSPCFPTTGLSVSWVYKSPLCVFVFLCNPPWWDVQVVFSFSRDGSDDYDDYDDQNNTVDDDNKNVDNDNIKDNYNVSKDNHEDYPKNDDKDNHKNIIWTGYHNESVFWGWGDALILSSGPLKKHGNKLLYIRILWYTQVLFLHISVTVVGPT